MTNSSVSNVACLGEVELLTGPSPLTWYGLYCCSFHPSLLPRWMFQRIVQALVAFLWDIRLGECVCMRNDVVVTASWKIRQSEKHVATCERRTKNVGDRGWRCQASRRLGARRLLSLSVVPSDRSLPRLKAPNPDMALSFVLSRSLRLSVLKIFLSRCCSLGVFLFSLFTNSSLLGEWDKIHRKGEAKANTFGFYLSENSC